MSIVVTSISKAFGEVQAVQDVSFEIARGDICGYIGPNGAGKTTTVKMLTGIIPPDKGSILIDGVEISTDRDAAKGNYGYVPENGNVYESLSALEYLLFAGRMQGLSDELITERAHVLLDYFGILNESNDIMSNYSKGMKQKVLLCSAMIHQPEIYFFDEPLNGLDAQATLLFKELLKQSAANGKTILYCSHLLDTVEKLCNTIKVIHKGEIVAEGNINELKERTSRDNLDEVFSSLTGGEDRVEKTSNLLDSLDALQS
jgi:ABC-2 type transport system ATP-binding protein